MKKRYSWLSIRENIARIIKAFAPVPEIGLRIRDRAAAERGFVMSRSRGNANLRAGRYVDGGQYAERAGVFADDGCVHV